MIFVILIKRYQQNKITHFLLPFSLTHYRGSNTSHAIVTIFQRQTFVQLKASQEESGHRHYTQYHFPTSVCTIAIDTIAIATAALLMFYKCAFTFSIFFLLYQLKFKSQRSMAFGQKNKRSMALQIIIKKTCEHLPT